MALCTLVDEKDQIIGYKERTELEPGDIYRITSLWVVNPRQQILLAQRALTKKNDPGKWGPAVAGTIENQESYDEGVTKEAREELGIAGVALTRGPKLFTSDNGHGQGYFCQTFITKLDWPLERFKLQAEEVAAIRWVSLGDLEQEMVARPEHFVVDFSSSTARMIAFMRDALEVHESA